MKSYNSKLLQNIIRHTYATASELNHKNESNTDIYINMPNSAKAGSYSHQFTKFEEKNRRYVTIDLGYLLLLCRLSYLKKETLKSMLHNIVNSQYTEEIFVVCLVSLILHTYTQKSFLLS